MSIETPEQFISRAKENGITRLIPTSCTESSHHNDIVLACRHIESLLSYVETAKTAVRYVSRQVEIKERQRREIAEYKRQDRLKARLRGMG